MIGDKSSFVVLGEASESDEEDYSSHSDNRFGHFEKDAPKMIVAGEASESDSEFDGGYNITAEAFKSKAEEAQYNSLLHKKLRENNSKLKQDMKDLVNNSLKFASEQVNDINQRLLTNQIEIQETIKNLRRSSVTSEKLDNILSCILTQNYLPSINVPHS